MSSLSKDQRTGPPPGLSVRTPRTRIAQPSPLSQATNAPTDSSGGSPNQQRTPLPSALANPNGTAGSGSEPHPKKKVQIHPDVPDAEAPCFIHSGLDRHGSLQDWLRKSDHSARHKTHMLPHSKAAPPPRAPRAPATRRHPVISALTPTKPVAPKPPTAENGGSGGSAGSSEITSPPELSGYDSDRSSLERSLLLDPHYGDADDDDDTDEDEPTSLTRQLAATAQGVREVSKELGRTKVHSRIQHILIVTKARDNRLIKLTRELALFLMLKKQPNTQSAAASAASSTVDLQAAAQRERERAAAASRGMVVYVDAQLRHSKRFDADGLQRDYPYLFEPISRRPRSSSMSNSATSISTLSSSWSTTDGNVRRKDDGQGQLRYWTADMCSNTPQLFDFVVTLGGDGTVLFTSWLFQKIVPPVLPFALGSLGFLTNFNFADFRPTMDRVIDEGIRVNLRMRFTCTVYRAIAPDEPMVIKGGKKRKAIRKPGGEILVRQVDKDGWEALEGASPAASPTIAGKDKEILCFSTRPVEQFEVLNDLVVDRGPSPFVSLLEVFGDDHHLTTVQADGLTVSTPTGSTAYSLSAGGSLVHPQIPALLMTPICPHTLSFRPMLLPDSMELRVCVPYNSRSTAWASFDGRGRVELKQGDHIKITASKYPFPTVCADKQSTDWFKSISRTLKWNERERQKSFVVVEEDHWGKEPNGDASHSSGDDDFYSESEDEFDIDDRSGGEFTPSPHSTDLGDPHFDDGFDAQPPSLAARRYVDLRADDAAYKSGVQSPDRFASAYHAPPPLSQRHMVEQLEQKLAKTSLDQEREREREAARDVRGRLPRRSTRDTSDHDGDEGHKHNPPHVHAHGHHHHHHTHASAPTGERGRDHDIHELGDPSPITPRASTYNYPPAPYDPAQHNVDEHGLTDDRQEHALPDDRHAADEFDEHAAELADNLHPLPEPPLARTESDATLGPSGEYREYRGHARRDSDLTVGGRTPRQGRSRSRSRARSSTRSDSPSLAGSSRRTKAFAFFGQDDSTSEISD